MNPIEICEPGYHDWTDIKEYGDGTKLQQCVVCGKTRRVSVDTE